jgi:hypothetical protein
MFSSTLIMSVLVVTLSGIVVAYVWPRTEARLEKLFVATFGALVGSLVGRVLSDPDWIGHLLYVAAGAFVFSALDWMSRKHRSTH